MDRWRSQGGRTQDFQDRTRTGENLLEQKNQKKETLHCDMEITEQGLFTFHRKSNIG